MNLIFTVYILAYTRTKMNTTLIQETLNEMNTSITIQEALNKNITLEKISIYTQKFLNEEEFIKKRKMGHSKKFTKDYKDIIDMAEENDFYSVGVANVDDWRASRMNKHNISAYKLNFAGRHIGFIMSMITNNGEYYWANFVLIDRRYQNKGFGTHAMTLFENEAKKMGLSSMIDIDIQLPKYVPKFARLVKFYKGLGYESVGIGDDGNLQMVKKLK